MRVTFLTRSLHPGGAERQLVSLAIGLHERGHRVLVASFYGSGPFERELREAGVPVCVLGKKGRWDVLGFLWRLVRLVRMEKPQVLHGYLGVPNVLTILLRSLFPRIRAVWGFRAAALDFARYDRVSRLSLRAERALSRFADLIVVNSRAGRRYAVEYGFPKNKIITIPNGIDTERFCPDPKVRQWVRAEWGVAEDEKLVGMVGRLIPIKDHPNFLEAAASLSHRHEGVKYVCIGDGPTAYRDELHALGQRLGLSERLIWTGSRGDMSAVYNALDVVASSSYGEGFPNVIGEGMACGVPCVVTDVGDSAWIVGETGVVVPSRDSEALSGGLEAALHNLGRANPAGIRERIVRHFSKQALVSATEGALRETIGR